MMSYENRRWWGYLILCNQGDLYWWTVITQGGTGGFAPAGEGLSETIFGNRSGGLGCPCVGTEEGRVSCRAPSLLPFSLPFLPLKRRVEENYARLQQTQRETENLFRCVIQRPFFGPQSAPIRLDIIMKVAEIQKGSKPQTWHMKRLLSTSCIW